MQINITLLKMLSIYTALLYTVVHFIWLFGNFFFSKCVFSRAKLAHSGMSRLKFQDMCLKLRRNPMLDSCPGFCLPNSIDFAQFWKAWVGGPFSSGLRCMCCLWKNHRAGTYAASRFSSRPRSLPSNHSSIPPILHSGECVHLRNTCLQTMCGILFSCL